MHSGLHFVQTCDLISILELSSFRLPHMISGPQLVHYCLVAMVTYNLIIIAYS